MKRLQGKEEPRRVEERRRDRGNKREGYKVRGVNLFVITDMLTDHSPLDFWRMPSNETIPYSYEHKSTYTRQQRTWVIIDVSMLCRCSATSNIFIMFVIYNIKVD